MYSDVRPATTSSKLAAGGRSFLSKLASPLKSRARNVADFHIRPFEPHRQYSPGDIVKGIVVLTVVKAIRVTHLTVALHGFVRVLKSPAAAGETIISEPAVPIANSRRSQYTGNGHASLFNDEITLCGEGRLEPGIYEFEFNLPFPTRGLPTSIDFERGTISYLIRATLTRPTSIGPTTTCEQKITLIENVDIGPMGVSQHRTISLEPIAKRSRKQIRSAVKLDTLAAEKESAAANARSAGDSPIGDENSNQTGRRGTTASSIRSRSLASVDLQSELSEESGASTSSTGYIIGQTTEAASEVARTPEPPATPVGPRKTIKAKIQLSKSGCLPGDSIPIMISIQHTKQIKSMHGIIITLYRQGRIDSAPPLSMFSDIKGKDLERLKHEEYYPRSKTGLGGLSLTSPASTGVFRKDLSQTLAPILIDPVSLSTVVTASLRVPEDVFPTITGVPGEMISFKYYVEVVIDLGGKLSGQDRHLPRLGMVSLPSMTNPTVPVIGRDSGVAPTLAAWGGNIVNTDRIRREKSVVTSTFDLVIGSTDSARLRGRGNTISRQTTLTRVATQLTEQASESSQHQSQHEPHQEERSGAYEDFGRDHEQRQWLPEETDRGYQYNQVPEDIPEEHPAPHYHMDAVPLPHIAAEEDLTEKDRVRLAEQRLLPSRPPGDAGPSSRADDIQPSAPPDPDVDAPVYASNGINGAAAHASSSVRPSGPSRPSTDTVTASSAPLAGPTPSQPPTDDKQELARRHLQAEASSPSDFPYDSNGRDGAGPSTRHRPTAPVLDEEDLYGDGYADHTFPGPSEHHDGLPEYQR